MWLIVLLWTPPFEEKKNKKVKIDTKYSRFLFFFSVCVLGLENNGLTVNSQLQTEAERWKWTWWIMDTTQSVPLTHKLWSYLQGPLTNFRWSTSKVSNFIFQSKNVAPALESTSIIIKSVWHNKLLSNFDTKTVGSVWSRSESVIKRFPDWVISYKRQHRTLKATNSKARSRAAP